jgi:hypothetical protein
MAKREKTPSSTRNDNFLEDLKNHNCVHVCVYRRMRVKRRGKESARREVIAGAFRERNEAWRNVSQDVFSVILSGVVRRENGPKRREG